MYVTGTKNYFQNHCSSKQAWCCPPPKKFKPGEPPSSMPLKQMTQDWGLLFIQPPAADLQHSVTKQAYRSKPWHSGSSTWNTRTVKHPTTALNLRITSKLDQLAETVILLCSSSFGTRVVLFCWCSFSRGSGRREGGGGGGEGWWRGCLVVFLFPR